MGPAIRPSILKFRRYAWFVLSYTILVIAWGAFVRATGSGAGCGDHWPLCNGEVIPQAPDLARMIEFSHRLTSGLSLIFVLGLVWFARRVFDKGHLVRRASWMSFLFILGEAAVGAMLVLLKLVADNDSALRAMVIALHLVNTFLLLFWLVRVIFETWEYPIPEVNRSYKVARFNIRLVLLAFAITGAAGSIVALGDTLFPSSSLGAGMAEDFSPAAHFLIRLRIWHPMIAVLTTVYVLLQSIILPKVYKELVHRSLALLVMGLICVQMLGGVVNWLLLAPVWMQLFHLIFADITWVAICFWYFLVGRLDANRFHLKGAL